MQSPLVPPELVVKLLEPGDNLFLQGVPSIAHHPASVHHHIAHG
jgi:hypothetical protein